MKKCQQILEHDPPWHKTKRKNKTSHTHTNIIPSSLRFSAICVPSTHSRSKVILHDPSFHRMILLSTSTKSGLISFRIICQYATPEANRNSHSITRGLSPRQYSSIQFTCSAIWSPCMYHSSPFYRPDRHGAVSMDTQKPGQKPVKNNCSQALQTWNTIYSHTCNQPCSNQDCIALQLPFTNARPCSARELIN